MNLLIKYPTRERPEIFKSTLMKYIDLLEEPEKTIIFISCDTTDHTMYNNDMVKWIDSVRIENNVRIFIDFNDNKSKIQAINSMMQDLGTLDSYKWDVCLLASDDMIPQVKGYDTFIKSALIGAFPDTDGALWLNDGRTFELGLNTIECVGYNYCKRFNFNLYHPSYKSLWCDKETTVIGLSLGKLVRIDNIIISNESPDWGGVNPQDQLYKKNNKHYYADERNYKNRKAAGFPL